MNVMRTILPIVAVALLCSCKKNQAGGNAEIRGRVLHHSSPVPNATVYIKYNAREFPGSDISLYNTQVIADASAGFSFKCYKGDYYLYGKGEEQRPDTLISVDGGVPVTVRSKEVVEANVAVSEQH